MADGVTLYDDFAHHPTAVAETLNGLRASHPDARRQGHGSRLLEHVIAFATRHKCRYVTLEVRRSNAGAIALYESFGFRAAGLRRRYYQDNGEDALIMWRTPGTLAGTFDDVPNAKPTRP